MWNALEIPKIYYILVHKLLRLCCRSNQLNPEDLRRGGFWSTKISLATEKDYWCTRFEQKRSNQRCQPDRGSFNWKGAQGPLECRERLSQLQDQFERNQTDNKRYAIKIKLVLWSFRFSVAIHFKRKSDIVRPVS